MKTYSMSTISEVARLLENMKRISREKNNGRVNKTTCFAWYHETKDCLISDGKHQVRLPYAEELVCIGK